MISKMCFCFAVCTYVVFAPSRTATGMFFTALAQNLVPHFKGFQTRVRAINAIKSHIKIIKVIVMQSVLRCYEFVDLALSSMYIIFNMFSLYM